MISSVGYRDYQLIGNPSRFKNFRWITGSRQEKSNRVFACLLGGWDFLPLNLEPRTLNEYRYVEREINQGKIAC